MRKIFEKVLSGFFTAQDARDADAGTFGGGIIRRTPFTASVLNSTAVNRRKPAMLRDVQCDPFEAINYGFGGQAAAANRLEPYRFQYVIQDGYKGFVPWEILPEIPEPNPWE